VARILNLVREEIRERVEVVMDDTRPEPFGVYVGTSDDPVATLARHVEREVFGDTFGNTPALLAEEYGPYESASLFFCVIDHRRRLPVGMARSILPSTAGLKSLNDLAREWGLDVDEVVARTRADLRSGYAWDCATIATMPDYRRGALFGLISMALYQALATSPLRCGFRWWVAILDAPVFRVLQWRLKQPFKKYDGVAPASYLGSASSIPVWSDLNAWNIGLAAADPILHDVIFGGRGLDDAVVPPDWARVEQLVSELTPARLATRLSSSKPTA
jgi:hypothetical protein